MIYSKDHHNMFIAKILHLILMINNGKMTTFLLTYFDLIFFTTHLSLVL